MSIRLWWFASSGASSSGVQPIITLKTLGGQPTTVTKGPTG